MDEDHYVFYGLNSMENYMHSLKHVEKFSPSSLKYSRKTMIEYNGQEIAFPTSDVHIEVDFEILGVNEYSIFFELYRHISENMVVNSKTTRLYVICLHFDQIKKELMDVFYNFMNNPKISFLILVKQICYVHPYILKRTTIKKIKSAVLSKYDVRFESKMDAMVENITGHNTWSLFQWREKLYELLVYNYNIHDCFAYLVQCLVEKEYLNDTNIDMFFPKYGEIMEKYNNNYRTIYHLERFILFLRNLKTTTQE